MANENKPISGYPVETTITANSKVLGINDAGKARLFTLAQLRSNNIGQFKTTDAAPPTPLLNQNYELIGTAVGNTPSGTYTNLLMAASTPLVIPAAGAGQAILNAKAVWNGTYWVPLYQIITLPSTDLSGYYTKVQVENRLSPISAAVNVNAGMNPVATGTASFGDGGNKACVLGAYTGLAGNLLSLSLFINSLGTGILTIVRLSGTAPSLTVISKTVITALGTGLQTFTPTDFGVIAINPNDSIAIEFTNGGATLWSKTETGNTGYYLSGVVSAGTQTWTTLPNSRHCGGYIVTYPTISVPRSAITPAFEAQLKPLDLLQQIVSSTNYNAGQNPVLSGSGAGVFGAAGNKAAVCDTWNGLTGYLASLTLNISVLGDGLIDIIRCSGVLPSQTFITRTRVTFTGTGVQTVAIAANLIPINTGDTISVEFPTVSGGVQIVYGSETGHTAYYNSGSLMSGTKTFNSLADTRYYIGYIVTVPGIVVPYANLAPNIITDIGYGKDPEKSRARTMLYDFSFGAGSAVPSPWTGTSGWTVASNYLIAPSGTTGMASYATDNTQINVQEFTRRIIVNAIASGSIIGIAGRGAGVADVRLGSLYSIDFSTNKINIHVAWQSNTTTQPAIFNSVTPPFTLTIGVDYLVEVFRDRRHLWISVYDPKSGLFGTVGDDGNAASGSNFTTGEFGDFLEVINLAGQSKFKNPCALVNKSNVGTYIVGDSLTEAYTLLITQGWAQLAAADTRTVTAISGRSGDKASGMAARAVSEMHQILPKRSIFHGGTNDTDTGLAAFQTNFTTWLNQCIADGIKPCAVRLAQRTGGTVSAINTWLDTQNIPLIRADIATTVGFDGSTKNTACFAADGIHYSILGAQLVFQRIAVDFPYFYD